MHWRDKFQRFQAKNACIKRKGNNFAASSFLSHLSMHTIIYTFLFIKANISLSPFTTASIHHGSNIWVIISRDPAFINKSIIRSHLLIHHVLQSLFVLYQIQSHLFPFVFFAILSIQTPMTIAQSLQFWYFIFVLFVDTSMPNVLTITFSVWSKFRNGYAHK